MNFDVALPSDSETLSDVHVRLCRLKDELQRSGHVEDAKALAIADLVVLSFRHYTAKNRPIDEK